MDFELLKDIFAIIGVILTLAASIYAIKKYYLDKESRKESLYDKRYPIYEKTMGFITSIVRNGGVYTEEVFKFVRETKEREMLFGEDIHTFVTKLEKKALHLSGVTLKLEKLNVGEERTRLVDKERKMVEWFESQLKVAQELFGKYIRLDQ